MQIQSHDSMIYDTDDRTAAFSSTASPNDNVDKHDKKHDYQNRNGDANVCPFVAVFMSFLARTAKPGHPTAKWLGTGTNAT